VKKFDLFEIQTHPIPLNPHGLRANRTSPKWVDWFYLEEFWYNSSSHSAIGHSPFVALYGYEPQHFGIHPSVVVAAPDLDILAMRTCSYDSSN
jgi:hypothetical protein